MFIRPADRQVTLPDKMESRVESSAEATNSKRDPATFRQCRGNKLTEAYKADLKPLNLNVLKGFPEDLEGFLRNPLSYECNLFLVLEWVTTLSGPRSTARCN